jgi:hypothetical protein
MNYKKRKVIKTNKDGVKTRQVIKDGVVKKTVTRTEGGVEKEIERGNKRIEVQKYKDEGVKNRTVINMKKAKQNAVGSMAKSLSESAIKGAIAGSAFRNLPSSMVKEAMKPENNVIQNKIMKATENAMKEYGVEKDEGVKNRTVIDMVKNSAFRNLPQSMVKEAAKPENNVLPANQMDKFMQRANKAFISAATKSAKKQRKENK